MCCEQVRQMFIPYPILVLAPCPSCKNIRQIFIVGFFFVCLIVEFWIPFVLISGSKCWGGSTSPHQRNHAVRWEEETIQQPVWSQGANRRGDGGLQNETAETWWSHGLFSWAVVTEGIIPLHEAFSTVVYNCLDTWLLCTCLKCLLCALKNFVKASFSRHEQSGN